MSDLIGEKTRAVLLDFDDTMIGTIQNKWEQHKYVARRWYGIELSDDDLQRHWGKPLRRMIGLLYNTENIEEALERNRSVRLNYPKILFDPTIRVITHWRAAQKVTGIVTAHTREGLTHDLDELGIPRELFDYTQTSDDTEFHKPDPRVFDPALEWLAKNSIQPDETVYVGDGILDMEAAVAAGLGFIGVETGLITVEQFRELGAVAVKDLSYLISQS